MLCTGGYFEDADFDNNREKAEAFRTRLRLFLGQYQMTFRTTLRALRKVTAQSKRRVSLALYLLCTWHKPPQDVFRTAWKIIDEAPSKRLLKDRYGVPLRHVRHFRLRHAIKQVFPCYSPTVIADPQMLELIRQAPSVVASIHARTEFALCAALERAGQKCAIITADPVKPDEIQNYDFSTLPQNILREGDVFIQARAALKSGRVLICDADFIADKDLPSARVCISTSLFEFARKVKANLFFGYAQVSPDGAMNCIFKAASPHSTSSQEDAQRFIEFLKDVQSELSDLTIEDWTRPFEIKSSEMKSDKLAEDIRAVPGIA